MWQNGRCREREQLSCSNVSAEMEVTETSALVDMYAKCGSMLEARRVIAIRQAISLIEWTSLISGYA